MWTMAADGTKVTSEAGLDAEMVKFIAQSFNPDKRVKGYLAEGDEAWADITIKSLPITVQLRANPDTYLASAFWVGTKLLLAVMTGEEGDALTERAKQITSVPGALDCAKPLFERDGKTPSFTDVISYQFSECAEAIATLLDGFMPDKEIWKNWKGRFFGVGGGIVDAARLLPGAPAGVFQQLAGGVTIKVKRPEPPCATLASFKEALRGEGATLTDVRKITCSNGWAHGITTTGDGTTFDSTLVLIRYRDGVWELITALHEPIFYGTPESDKLCAELPANFRKSLCARI